MPRAVTPVDLEQYRCSFEADPKNKLAMNAVCNAPVTKVALNRDVVTAIDHTYSVQLPENNATAQLNSGRCWMFAALNVLRYESIRHLNVTGSFEFSQNYLLFWDKLEKANYFLQMVSHTLDKPENDRTLAFLFANPVSNAGQWHLFVNLVKKYGLVPKTVMPETESSSSTGQLVDQLSGLLRSAACQMRTKNAEPDVVQTETMAIVYRVLSIHLGEPPRSFDWQWRDKDGEHHRDGVLTPQDFFDRHVRTDLDRYVRLMHDPRPSHPDNQAYQLAFTGNVIEGEPLSFLNVQMSMLKDAAVKQLKSGRAVVFGADVTQFKDRDLGVLDDRLFDFSAVYGFTPKMDKAQRLSYGQSSFTHSMVLTGVDLDDEGSPRKWRVENSWGEGAGDRGFFLMTDSWFDEYVYEAIVLREFVPDQTLMALEGQPIVLDPWDALA